MEAADLMVAVAGGGDGGVRHHLVYLLLAVAQLTQHGDDRDHVVDVENAVADELVFAHVLALTQLQRAARDVDVLRQILRVRGVEAAGRADGVADVVIAAVGILQLRAALRADLAVVEQVHAVRHVAGHAVDAKVDALVLRRNRVGDEIVGVQNERRLFRHGL